jgi:hypothetical protein
MHETGGVLGRGGTLMGGSWGPRVAERSTSGGGWGALLALAVLDPEAARARGRHEEESLAEAGAPSEDCEPV